MKIIDDLLKFLNSQCNEMSIKRRWQRFLYSLFVMVIIVGGILIAMWYMSSGKYYNAAF